MHYKVFSCANRILNIPSVLSILLVVVTSNGVASRTWASPTTATAFVVRSSHAIVGSRSSRRTASLSYCLQQGLNKRYLLAFSSSAALHSDPSPHSSARSVDLSKTASMTDNTKQEEEPKHALELFGLPQPLLLGSGSFTRKLVLKEMGIPFRIVSRPIDEDAIGNRETDPPDQLVLTLAMAKMKHLVQEIQAGRCESELPPPAAAASVVHDFVILTGDQVVTCNGHILEKPQTVQQAKEFVARYGSHPPSTVGSCVLTHFPTNTTVSGVDTATIHFQPFIGAGADSLVDTLMAEGAPILSCSGGLMVEHPLVQKFINHIDGTVDSVMGLSKDLVLRLLQELSEKIISKQQQQR